VSADSIVREDVVRIEETEEGLVLEVSVKPRSREFRITIEGDDVVVFCREEPVSGRVNKELVKEFSRLLHKPVRLVSGFTSKQKRLLIVGAEKNEVEHALLHG
jgi:uncharacterized protein (TIGR00251 family)